MTRVEALVLAAQMPPTITIHPNQIDILGPFPCSRHIRIRFKGDFNDILKTFWTVRNRTLLQELEDMLQKNNMRQKSPGKALNCDHLGLAEGYIFVIKDAKLRP